MFACFETLIDRDEFIRRFKMLVFVRYYKDGVRCGPVLPKELTLWPKGYESEEKYMTTQTNNIHQKFLDEHTSDDPETIYSKWNRNEIQKVDRRITIATLFKFVLMTQYRFETYFNDWGIIYPFDGSYSESVFDVLDEVHAENCSDALEMNIPPAQQAGINFGTSLQFLLKENKMSRNMPVYHSVLDLLGMNENKLNRLRGMGGGLVLEDVLRTSYHFQVHPYQLMGLRRIEYPMARWIEEDYFRMKREERELLRRH